MVAVAVEEYEEEEGDDAFPEEPLEFDRQRWGGQYDDDDAENSSVDSESVTSKGESLKDLCDLAYAEGKLREAYAGYTELINENESTTETAVPNPVLYINRALCALKMKQLDDAEADADSALDLILQGREEPEELATLPKDVRTRAAKGYYIKADAKYQKEDSLGAISDARAGLFLLKGNVDLSRLLRKCVDAMNAYELAAEFTELVEEAESPLQFSSRDGKHIKPVQDDIKLSTEQLCECLEKFTLGREAEVRSLLLMGWRYGTFPLGRFKFMLAALRSAAYARANSVKYKVYFTREEQAVKDGKLGVAFSPEMERQAWQEELDQVRDNKPWLLRDPKTGRLPTEKEIKERKQLSLAQRMMNADEENWNTKQIVNRVDEQRKHLALIPAYDGGGGILDSCVDAPHLAITSAGTGISDGCVNVPRKLWGRGYHILGYAYENIKSWKLAAIAYRRAFETEPMNEEFVDDLRMIVKKLPEKDREVLLERGADRYEVYLTEEKLMNGPEYLRPKEKYSYYYQWMRERIYEHYPNLPESVMQKLLKHDAHELDLLLQYPKAIKGQTDEYLEVYRQHGGEYLETYQTPTLTWEEVKAMKGAGTAGLGVDADNPGGPQGAPGEGYIGSVKNTDHALVAGRGDGGLTEAERAGLPVPTQLPPDAARDFDQMEYYQNKRQEQLESQKLLELEGKANPKELSTRQQAVMGMEKTALARRHTLGKPDAARQKAIMQAAEEAVDQAMLSATAGDMDAMD